MTQHFVEIVGGRREQLSIPVRVIIGPILDSLYRSLDLRRIEDVVAEEIRSVTGYSTVVDIRVDVEGDR